jgi:hypothetical protein
MSTTLKEEKSVANRDDGKYSYGAQSQALKRPQVEY